MEWLSAIYTSISTFFNWIINFIASIWGFLDSMWYSLTTILTWFMDLVREVFSSWIF